MKYLLALLLLAGCTGITDAGFEEAEKQEVTPIGDYNPQNEEYVHILPDPINADPCFIGEPCHRF